MIRLKAFFLCVAAVILLVVNAEEMEVPVFLGSQTEADEFTEIAMQIMLAEDRYQKCNFHTKDNIKENERCLRKYEAELRPYLAEGFSGALRDWINMRVAVRKLMERTQQLSYISGLEEPVFKWGWSPLARVITRESLPDEPAKTAVILTGLLVDSKIWSGQQEEVRMIFLSFEGKWLLDDIEYRRRPNRGGWENDAPSARENLRSSMMSYAKYLMEEPNKESDDE